MMKQVNFYDLKINDNFWSNFQNKMFEKTVWAVYDRFYETGRITTMDLHSKGYAVSLNLHDREGISPHEDCYEEMAKALGINPEDKKRICFDFGNYMGLPSLLFYYVQTGADIKKLKIIGPKKDVRRIVQKAMDFLCITEFWGNVGMPQIIEIEGGDTFETEDMLFQTVSSNHPVQGMCYRITDKNTGKVICATGDTAVNDALPDFFKNCDALIHEISWGYRENHYGSKLPSGHSTVNEAINLASEIKTKKLFFVHNSRDTANMAVNDAKRVERLEAVNPVIGKKYIID